LLVLAALSFCLAISLVTSSVLADTVVQTELMKLTASDGGEGDVFGVSVAVSGDMAFIGASYDDNYGMVDIGSVYVFRYDGSDWVEEEKLAPSDGAGGDHFGGAVAVSGDTVVVGSMWDDDDGSYSGSAYVFRYDGSDWVEEEKLTASDAVAYDYFGGSVGISGDTIVVGAYGNDDYGPYTGSAYIFRYDGSEWVEEEILTASDGSTYDYFGVSVAVSGDTVVVGANGSNGGSGSYSGSAYVFRYDGSDWLEEEKLSASDGAPDDYLGDSVAISGDTVVAGAINDDDNGSDSGSAYIFRYDGSDWVEDAKLTASDGAAFDTFGGSVVVSGDAAVVGACHDDDNGDGSGSAYVFRYDGNDWVEDAKLTASDGAEFDCLGMSVAVSGSMSMVGAHADDAPMENSGSAYVFAVPESSVIFMDGFESGTTSAWTVVVS